MALEREADEAMAARADRSIRFTATAGEQNGPYDPAGFGLRRGDQAWRGERMAVDGALVEVFFPVQPEPGDEVRTPSGA